MLAIALLAAASLLPEFEVVVGYASPNADGFREGPLAPALGARAGIDFADHLTLSARVLGVAGPETSSSFCGGSGGCRSGSASFRAISGFASLRLHTAGDLQGFIEGDLGVGHLISLSDNDLFENPAEHGRGGLAYQVGAGGRWFVTRGVALGVELAWTSWTNVSRPAFTYGNQNVPARNDLAASAFLVLLSVGFSPGR